MNQQEMIEYATAVRDGKRNVKRAELVAFMTTLLTVASSPDGETASTRAQTEPERPGPLDPTIIEDMPAGADGSCPVCITRTISGVHLPPEANRSYTKREGRALGRALFAACRE